MLGNLPADYKAQEQLAIQKSKTYEADQANDPFVQFNKAVEAVGQTLGGWAQSYAETADSLSQYDLPREELREMEIRNNLEPGVLTDRDRHQEVLQSFGQTSEAIMHPIQGFVKDRLMDAGMGYEQAKAFTSLGELMIATGAGRRLLRGALNKRVPGSKGKIGAGAMNIDKKLGSVIQEKVVNLAAELSDWRTEGVMPPMMKATLATLNPKNFPIYNGTYEAFRAAAIAQIKHKNNPDGISPTEFYKTVGVFPKVDKNGELNLILPRGDKAQTTGLQFPTTGNVARYTGKRKENLSAQTYGAPTFFKIPGTDAHHMRPPATYSSFFENLKPFEQQELARFAAEDLMLPLGDSEFNAAWIDAYTHNLGIHKYDRLIGHKPGQKYNKGLGKGILIPKEYTLEQRKVALQIYTETIQANMDEAMFALRMAKQFPQNDYWIKQAKRYLNDYLDFEIK